MIGIAAVVAILVVGSLLAPAGPDKLGAKEPSRC
jgi:hypothetical protein